MFTKIGLNVQTKFKRRDTLSILRLPTHEHYISLLSYRFHIQALISLKNVLYFSVFGSCTSHVKFHAFQYYFNWYCFKFHFLRINYYYRQYDLFMYIAILQTKSLLNLVINSNSYFCEGSPQDKIMIKDKRIKS